MRWFSSMNSVLPARLSAEEAAEVAAQVAELAKAGLPLDAGLRAAADELRGGRVPGVLRAMADQLSAGSTLDAAFAAQEQRLPAHVRGLVLAAVRSGRLAQVFEEFVDLQQGLSQLQWRLGMILAYPIVLLTLLLPLLYLMGRLSMAFAKVFADFKADLPAMTKLFMRTAGPMPSAAALIVLLLAVLVLAVAMPNAGGVSWLTDRIPLLGSQWRWGRLAYVFRLLGLLLTEGVPLPEALRLAAGAVPAGPLATACRRTAGEVEAGRPLGESLADQRAFPRSLIPLVKWGERRQAVPEAFRAAAEMFDGRAHHQQSVLQAILLPTLFMLIVTLVGGFVIAMLMPLISFIQMLA
jgi:type IV pilus assembly protein PilC